MDVLLTPDVISHLGISSSTIHSENTILPSVVFAFSKTHISFISNVKPRPFISPTVVEIRTRLNTFSLPIMYESLMQTTTKHWIITFAYSPENIISPLRETWETLLDISQVQQQRADVRIAATIQNLSALRINSMANEVWFHGTKISCSIQNISFSGVRILCIENELIEGDDKLVLKIQFTEPSEIASIRGTVLRKQTLEIAGTLCMDLAVRFLNPIDFVFRSRLADYFQKQSECN